MKHIRVLGFDCAACRKAHARTAEVAAELGADIHLEKVGDPRELAAARVLVSPGWWWTAAWCIPAGCRTASGSKPGWRDPG